jgi:hypothetical protein
MCFWINPMLCYSCITCSLWNKLLLKEQHPLLSLDTSNSICYHNDSYFLWWNEISDFYFLILVQCLSENIASLKKSQRNTMYGWYTFIQLQCLYHLSFLVVSISTIYTIYLIQHTYNYGLCSNRELFWSACIFFSMVCRV